MNNNYKCHMTSCYDTDGDSITMVITNIHVGLMNTAHYEKSDHSKMCERGEDVKMELG